MRGFGATAAAGPPPAGFAIAGKPRRSSRERRRLPVAHHATLRQTQIWRALSLVNALRPKSP
jgi:hypothetical protein